MGFFLAHSVLRSSFACLSLLMIPQVMPFWVSICMFIVVTMVPVVKWYGRGSGDQHGLNIHTSKQRTYFLWMLYGFSCWRLSFCHSSEIPSGCQFNWQSIFFSSIFPLAFINCPEDYLSMAISDCSQDVEHFWVILKKLIFLLAHFDHFQYVCWMSWHSCCCFVVTFPCPSIY